MDRLQPTSRSNMPKLSKRAMSVSNNEQYESMKSAQTETSSTSAFRVVMTRELLNYLSTHYADVAPYYFAKYEHEMHQYGIDLLNVSEDDAKLLKAYYEVYLNNDSQS